MGETFKTAPSNNDDRPGNKRLNQLVNWKIVLFLLKLQQPGHIAVEGGEKDEIYGATVACRSIFCKHSSFYNVKCVPGSFKSRLYHLVPNRALESGIKGR